MVSLQSSIKTSTHGRTLLNELRDPSTVSIDVIFECLRKDPLSGRLKSADTGDNAYHLLLSRGYGFDFMMRVLKELLITCPEGVRSTNNRGSLPLHCCLTQHRLHLELIKTVLQAYPAGAAVADNQGLIPLFLCTMRDDITADIVKVLCKAFPEGPCTKNKTNSFPLHFAAKRQKPNVEVLRILLRRNPTAAGAMNDFGLLPIHCITALSDIVEAARMIHEADPESVKVVDRQGRTCLHLAVLNIGKEHSQAVTLEEEELHMQAQREASRRQVDETHAKHAKHSANNSSNDALYDSDYDDEDAEHGVNSSKKAAALELMERDGKSRGILRFLVSVFPQALCMENNFQATPVDTVLEKTKPVRAKNKILSVYGLYNDPPTARLLLLAQRNRSRAFNPAGVIANASSSSGLNSPSTLLHDGKICALPNLRPRYTTALRDFNWMARKDVLYVSLVGELRYCSVLQEGKDRSNCSGAGANTSYMLKYNAAADSTSTSNSNNKAAVSTKKAVTKVKVGTAAVKTVKATKSATTAGATAEDIVFAQMAALQIENNPEVVAVADSDNSGYRIPNNNLLARFRRQGMDELVRAIVAFI